jgi:lysylphosphatidylglycerol synthetase-like protein (DUF2156 family)
MTPALMALTVALLVALAGVIALVIGTVARSLARDRLPRGHEPIDVHALGHRTAQWLSCILLAGALTMLAVEQWA